MNMSLLVVLAVTGVLGLDTTRSGRRAPCLLPVITGLINFVREGSGAAGHGGGKEGGLTVAGHDDDDAILEEQRGLGLVAAIARGFPVTVCFAAGLEVAGEMPEGAEEDEEGERDETQHRR